RLSPGLRRAGRATRLKPRHRGGVFTMTLRCLKCGVRIEVKKRDVVDVGANIEPLDWSQAEPWDDRNRMSCPFCALSRGGNYWLVRAPRPASSRSASEKASLRGSSRALRANFAGKEAQEIAQEHPPLRGSGGSLYPPSERAGRRSRS